MSPENDCGICGEREAKVCSHCHVKDVEDLNQKIATLEKNFEEIARVLQERISANYQKLQKIERGRFL
ncbi:hypothetical protein ES703_87580 [subsurface metagenome]